MNKPPPRTPRPGQSVTPRSTAAVPANVERALALRDVMDHAVRVQREVTDPKLLRSSRARPILPLVFCALLLALSAYSWIARPEFIWGPSARSETVERREANLRFGMFLLANRIQSQRVASGRYPSTMEEVGGAPAGVTFRVVSDSVFELRAPNAGKPIVFRSNEPARVFLGSSPRIIGGTQR